MAKMEERTKEEWVEGLGKRKRLRRKRGEERSCLKD